MTVGDSDSCLKVIHTKETHRLGSKQQNRKVQNFIRCREKLMWLLITVRSTESTKIKYMLTETLLLFGALYTCEVILSCYLYRVYNGLCSPLYRALSYHLAFNLCIYCSGTAYIFDNSHYSFIVTN